MLSWNHSFGDLESADKIKTIKRTDEHNYIHIMRDNWERVYDIRFCKQEDVVSNRISHNDHDTWHKQPCRSLSFHEIQSRYMLIRLQTSLSIEIDQTTESKEYEQQVFPRGKLINIIKIAYSHTGLVTGVSFSWEPSEDNRSELTDELVSVSLESKEEKTEEIENESIIETPSIYDEPNASPWRMESITDDQLRYIQIVILAVCITFIALWTFWIIDRDEKVRPN